MQALYELCAKSYCRPPGQVVLQLENGETFSTAFESPVPVVQNDWVSLFPGETIIVEAEVKEDRLTRLRAVGSVEDAARTLELRMWQEPGKPDVFLSVRNPFDRDIKYHALMMNTDSDALYETSTCPVMANGKMVLEHWPHPIFQLLFFDFRLLDSGKEDMVCEF